LITVRLIRAREGPPLAPPRAKRSGRCSSTAFSAQSEKVIEFFLEREAAEAMIREVREDEPALAEVLRVEAIELG
jgi:hypothetical protein